MDKKQKNLILNIVFLSTSGNRVIWLMIWDSLPIDFGVVMRAYIEHNSYNVNQLHRVETNRLDVRLHQ